MNYDFIVVGHGLAGAILSDTLRSSGYKVIVVDEPKSNSASNVAAGLVNPIAGKRFAKTWMADQLIPAADSYYDSLETRFGKPLFFHKPIYKIFATIEDQNNWMAKSAEVGWNNYIEATYAQSLNQPGIHDPFGGIIIKHGGYLQVSETLDLLRQELLDSNLMLEERFDINQLTLTNEGVNYKEITAGKVAFCEGYQVMDNPYFNWVPLQPTKGEVLDVKTQNFNPECIYNKAVYVVPIGGGEFRVGATYDWRHPNEEPTLQAQEELTERFRQITSQEFYVAGQKVGIRPAVRDRMPLIGPHPAHKQLIIFNGMGSKGVLMAPYLAQQFVAHLAGAVQLPAEVQISRYLSLYYEYIKLF